MIGPAAVGGSHHPWNRLQWTPPDCKEKKIKRFQSLFRNISNKKQDLYVSPDKAVAVLVHLAEQLPGLAHVGVVIAHHLVHCGHHSDKIGIYFLNLLQFSVSDLLISLKSMEPLPSTSYILKAQASFSSGLPWLVACRASMNSLKGNKVGCRQNI